MGILDFLFPKRCVICKKYGSYICENCFSKLSFDVKSICLVCDKPTYNNLTHPLCLKKYSIDGCFSALSYNKPTQKLIFNFKYKPYIFDLKEVLGDLFYESIIQNEYFNNEIKKAEWLIVPIPLFVGRLRKRGYNQAEVLAEELSKRLEIKTANILKRVRDTNTQVGKSNKQRKENIKKAFQIQNSRSMIQNANIFLVDDIVTTGSTLREASSILKREGAKKIIGLTLARD